MVSILIPVFRYDVRPLVGALLEQASGLDEEWEIICLDDGSPDSVRERNRELAGKEGVTYLELPQNVGRSRVRNLLAEKARFPNLLFMDCDGMPGSPDFLKKYLPHCGKGYVVSGTRAYLPTPPADPDLFFHWYYGRSREQRPAAERNQHPYDAFCTFHFLCPRDIFLSIRLDESLRQYGHEDTQFGSDLREKGIPVVHIDNDYIHMDVETVDVFLEKTRQGIENLAYLSKKNPQIGSRLLQTYRKINLFAKPIAWSFRLIRPLLERQLHSRRPNMRLFDVYKLGWLATLNPQPGIPPGSNPSGKKT